MAYEGKKKPEYHFDDLNSCLCGKLADYGIFSIVIGIAGGIFGSCAGLLFGGLGLVGAGIYKMFTTVPYGLLLMGSGFLMIAGGILLLWFLVWICATAIPWIIAKIREFWNRNFGRGCE